MGKDEQQSCGNDRIFARDSLARFGYFDMKQYFKFVLQNLLC